MRNEYEKTGGEQKVPSPCKKPTLSLNALKVLLDYHYLWLPPKTWENRIISIATGGFRVRKADLRTFMTFGVT